MNDTKMDLDAQIELLRDLHAETWAKIGEKLGNPRPDGLRIERHEAPNQREVLRNDDRVFCVVYLRRDSEGAWFDVEWPDE